MANDTTNTEHRSVSEIEREVDNDRRRVSETIDALQDKASIGSIVDQVMTTFGEHGGEAGRNLGRTVRDNPLPVLLTGVGLVWLMAGGTRERRVHDDDYLFDNDDAWDDDFEQGTSADRAGGYAQPYPNGDPLAGTATGSGSASGFAESSPGFSQKARDSAASVGGKARDTAASVGDAAGEQLRRARGSAQAAGQGARRRADRARQGTMRAAHDLQDGLDRMIQDQPLAMGALALALGAAFGGALPSSRTEDELFGAQSDQLKRAARDVAEEEGAKLGATAGAVVGEAREMMDETAAKLDQDTGDGKAMVDRAAERTGDAARRLADAGREEAKRQDLGNPKSAG